MDFITIDLDKHDVWEAFRQPVPVKAQMYVKTANWNPGTPSEEVECPPGGDPNDVCYTDDQEQQQSFGQATPTFGNSGTGAGTTHQDPDSNQGDGFGGGGLSEEQKRCAREQDVDEAAQAAANDIKSRSGWRRREYGTAIYVGPNGVRLGQIFRGNSSGVDIPIRRQPGEVVAGIIHSHPRGDVGAPSEDDWDNTDLLVSGGLTDGDNFSNFIVDGNNGELNEFDNNEEDRDLDGPNRQTREDAQGTGGACNNV